MDPEEPECYICKEMDPFLASRVQVMLGYNVFECYRINGNFVWYVYSAAASRDIVLPERSAPVKKHNSESYEDFHDVWSKDTTEKDRPSFVTKKSADVNQPSFRKSSETLRDLVICGECLKVCCVYSAKALTKEQFLQFKKCKEDYIYVCGTTVIPSENNLSKILYFEHGINCDKEISPHYYSARQKFVPVCYLCGVLTDLVPIPGGNTSRSILCAKNAKVMVRQSEKGAGAK